MAQFEHLTLDNVGGGAAVSLFDRELGRVLENIADLNTDSKFKRKIKLEIVFEPNEDRDVATVLVRSDAKLAPVKTSDQLIHIVSDGKNRPRAVYQDPRQGDLFHEPDEPEAENVHPITKA